MKFLIAFFASLVCVNGAKAYIPNTEFILSRTAENTPRSGMSVEYSITFENGTHSYGARESWIIADNGQMKMKVTQGLQLDIAYTGAERVFQDKQSRKTQKLSGEFLERTHFWKSADAYSRAILELGVPREKLQSPILSRGGGVVNYGFFERAVSGPGKTENVFPGMWIEQDQFLLRQIRFRTQALFQIHDYLQVGKFFFPKNATVAWGKNLVHIRTLSAAERKNIRPSDLSVENNLDLNSVPAEIKSTILEFYSRFR